MRSDTVQSSTYDPTGDSLGMTEPDPAELPSLNQRTPPLDAPVAVEWWFKFEEDGQPDLDTFHGFHDAMKIADGEPPAVTGTEVVTSAGVSVEPNSDSKADAGEDRKSVV